ncbi:MAG: hypothetical protein ACD_10C00462G0001 [uncultured bacterium]|nr:MAG: hypothetical protein ACD_10C00462G0001 [uncultured bacterium]
MKPKTAVTVASSPMVKAMISWDRECHSVSASWRDILITRCQGVSGMALIEAKTALP